MNDAVRDLFEELNRPSAARLKTALRARGIAYDPKVVDAVVSRSTEKQQQAPAYKYTGKIVSTDANVRWAMDTINLTSRPSKGQRYVVVAQDIFTRRVFAKASPSVSPAAGALAIVGAGSTEWPFEAEYWSDEIGSYRAFIKEKCSQ